MWLSACNLSRRKTLGEQKANDRKTANTETKKEDVMIAVVSTLDDKNGCFVSTFQERGEAEQFALGYFREFRPADFEVFSLGRDNPPWSEFRAMLCVGELSAAEWFFIVECDEVQLSKKELRCS